MTTKQFQIGSIFFGLLLIIILTIGLFSMIKDMKHKSEVINTYDSASVDKIIDYKDGVYTIDIEKYNKHFSVNEKDTRIIVYYENKAIVEEYSNGSAKIYFYIGMD